MPIKKLFCLIVIAYSASFAFAQDAVSVQAPVSGNMPAASPVAADSKASQADSSKVTKLDLSSLSNDPYVKLLLQKQTISQRQHMALEGIADGYTKRRVARLLEESDLLLDICKIDEIIFEGKTLGISNYTLMSTLVLLLVYGLAAIILAKLLFFVAIKISKHNRLHSFSEILESIKTPISFLIYANAIYVSFWRFALSLDLALPYDNFFTVLFTVLFTWLILRIVEEAASKTEKIAKKHAGTHEVFMLFRRVVWWLIIIASFLILVGRLGYNVRGFMVSLGIGGAALAFASKDTIANFFGSISLIMDAPFRIGDRIQVPGKLDGIVEAIGMRSTRLRNLDDTVSILPNSYLANEYIINVSGWQKRRIETVIGLTYSTTPDQIRKIIADIKDFLWKDPAIAASTVTVFFQQFADSSLNIKVLCFATSTDTAAYNATVERINLGIMHIVAQNNAEIAFPSRTVYIQK